MDRREFIAAGAVAIFLPPYSSASELPFTSLRSAVNPEVLTCCILGRDGRLLAAAPRQEAASDEWLSFKGRVIQSGRPWAWELRKRSQWLLRGDANEGFFDEAGTVLVAGGVVEASVSVALQAGTGSLEDLVARSVLELLDA